MSTFLRTEGAVNYFDFRCPSCGAEGEIGLDANDLGQFGCPERCGAGFVHYRANKVPAVRCVVRPVRASEEAP